MLLGMTPRQSQQAGSRARSDLDCWGLERQTKIKNYFHTLELKKEEAIHGNAGITVSSISSWVRLRTQEPDFYVDG